MICFAELTTLLVMMKAVDQNVWNAYQRNCRATLPATKTWVEEYPSNLKDSWPNERGGRCSRTACALHDAGVKHAEPLLELQDRARRDKHIPTDEVDEDARTDASAPGEQLEASELASSPPAESFRGRRRSLELQASQAASQDLSPSEGLDLKCEGPTAIAALGGGLAVMPRDMPNIWASSKSRQRDVWQLPMAI